jgi:hypothetical protein
MNCKDFIPELQLREGCPCDRFTFPPGLNIIAGLNDLPRQIAGFHEFRKAMLAAIRPKHRLYMWRAREGGDPGIMLLEMWAYICDSISFYDQVIANESYLSPARQRESVRKLVSLLGYLPRPAVASVANLAAIAEGSQMLKIPAGTAFRSGAFDGNPPQVFETTGETTIHPFTNRWNVAPKISDTVIRTSPPWLLIKPLAGITPGVILFFQDSGNELQNQVITVKETIPCTTNDKTNCQKVFLEEGLSISGNTRLSGITLYHLLHTAGILEISYTKPRKKKKEKNKTYEMTIEPYKMEVMAWKREPEEDPLSQVYNTITLDKLYQGLSEGDYILVSKGREFRWFKIGSVDADDVTATEETSIEMNGYSYKIPGNTIKATKLVLNRAVNADPWNNSKLATWDSTNCHKLTVHFGLKKAGQIINEPDILLPFSEKLALKDPVEKPQENHTPENFILTDNNNRGIGIKASLNYTDKLLELYKDEEWSGELAIPVVAYGNVIGISRGETVRDEILGSGDASLANQTFKLKKKPLTYLFSPSAENDQAVKSTLGIRVGGIPWKEAANFFTSTSSDQVYIVRQDEEGESYITFGDGIYGQRLPSGIANVIATYRFGAGKVAPPAGSVTQVASPVKGLKSVLNPLAAAGGADAETEKEMKTVAPKSALLMGRIVSIMDVEAAVGSVPGVIVFKVEWRWSETRQGALIHVYFTGESTVRSLILERLTAITDPNVTFHVEKADLLLTE